MSAPGRPLEPILPIRLPVEQNKLNPTIRSKETTKMAALQDSHYVEFCTRTLFQGYRMRLEWTSATTAQWVCCRVKPNGSLEKPETVKADTRFIQFGDLEFLSTEELDGMSRLDRKARYKVLNNSKQHEHPESRLASHEYSCEDAYIMAAGASGPVPHILDGYSSSVVCQVRATGGRPCLWLGVEPCVRDYERYENDKKLMHQKCCPRMEIGLLSGTIAWWKKALCIGSLCTLLAGNSPVVKDTAHQPLYIPWKDHGLTLLSTTSEYLSLMVSLDKKHNQLRLKEGGWTPMKRADEPHGLPNYYYYLCMHPHYDMKKDMMLSYAFKHSVVTRDMTVIFYEFSSAEGSPARVKYKYCGNSALHMFGFTENYFVLFSNPLELGTCGNLRACCGVPVLRTLDDDFVRNLVIHFVRRPSGDQTLPAFFSIDTRRPAWIYHTINCFEVGVAREKPDFAAMDDIWAETRTRHIDTRLPRDELIVALMERECAARHIEFEKKDDKKKKKKKSKNKTKNDRGEMAAALSAAGAPNYDEMTIEALRAEAARLGVENRITRHAAETLLLFDECKLRGLLPGLPEGPTREQLQHALDEDHGCIYVDGYISVSNAEREASQFELTEDIDYLKARYARENADYKFKGEYDDKKDNPVFDNAGDPVRFRIPMPHYEGHNELQHSERAIKQVLLSSDIDSSIDFQCINYRRQGRAYHHLWIVAHDRVRDDEGRISAVHSKLHKVDMPVGMSFDPSATTRSVSSREWSSEPDTERTYMRSPLFVPRVPFGSVEDDGTVFVWSYELREKCQVALLLFNASDLCNVMRIGIPQDYYLPYSIHSWVHNGVRLHGFPEDPSVAEEEREAEIETKEDDEESE